jgi:hypothetical protein
VGHIAIYAARDHFVMDRLRRVLHIAEEHARGAEETSELHALRGELEQRQTRAEAAA